MSVLRLKTIKLSELADVVALLVWKIQSNLQVSNLNFYLEFAMILTVVLLFKLGLKGSSSLTKIIDS